MEEKKTRRRRPTKQTETKMERYNRNFKDLLSSLPDHTKVYNENTLGDLYLKYEGLPIEELQLILTDVNLPQKAYAVVINLIDSVNPDSKDRLSASKYVASITHGKVKDRIEHTGANGAPIEISQSKIEEEIDLFIDTLSEEELDEYEKMVKLKEKFKNIAINSKKLND